MVVSCEMVRMSMKMHAYLREKMLYGRNNKQKQADAEVKTYAEFIPKWAEKHGVEISDLDLPQIEIGTFYEESIRFLYFHFVPTLIYRDSYIRSPSIRWPFVVRHITAFLLIIFYIWCIFKALCIPVFKNHMQSPSSLHQFIHSVTSSTVTGTVCLLTLFYGILHTWFNIFAELFRFGDRLFYEDWWNVKDFANYYR